MIRPIRASWLKSVIVIGVFCGASFGQELSGPSKASVDLLGKPNNGVEVSPPKGSLFRAPSILALQKSPPSITYPRPADPGSALGATFIYQDGAVYLSVFGNVLIPMPGGGASGCFSSNLPDRIENLRRLIENFPQAASKSQ